MGVKLLTGDCREVLRTLPAASVHCVVTSPPYWGLRNYGVSGQIGLEPTIETYVSEIVEVFREVRRVLRHDGTVWLNLGDGFAGSGVDGLKPKDLLMMPARVALALQTEGWWVRSDIIWAKLNPMPESATDRPIMAHEHVFLLVKSARYFYDPEAVREAWTCDRDDMRSKGVRTGLAYLQQGPIAHNSLPKAKVQKPAGWADNPGQHGTINLNGRTSANYHDAPPLRPGRNLRNVWSFPTEPFPEAHFATYPTALAERCIKAGTSERGCCAACGAPWRRVTEAGEPDLDWQRACGGDAQGAYTGTATKDYASAGAENASDVKRRILASLGRKRTAGWEASCVCNTDLPLVPCTVLDPFSGAGTTCLVADRLQRHAIGIELNQEYTAMAEHRLAQDAGLFAEVAAD